MDFDTVKENIMPLAGGRNARCLETVLSAESHHEVMVELQKKRQEFESVIHAYEGDDPLEPWFDYIQWIEQSYPSGGKENGLSDVLVKCLTTFEHNEKYFQDRRMIKLYIKYIDTQSNPQEFYQELFNAGIGTMVADLYICWAYYYDLIGNFSKADEIYRKGLAARAQPFDELDQAHKHFGFTMSQRILHKDDESNSHFMSSMLEKRHALTSLRTHKKKVGSIRTGAAVKSLLPGKVQVDTRQSGPSSNVGVAVFEDQNKNPNAELLPDPAVVPAETPTPQSVVRSIIDSTRKQENTHEPGPWSKARLHDRRKGSLFASTSHQELAFEILEDEAAGSATEMRAPLPNGADNFSRGIQLPANFVARNEPQTKWDVPLSLETSIPANSYPNFQKNYLYPKPNQVYSHEELAAYRWFRKRSIDNSLTQRLDPIWSDNFHCGIRVHSNFASTNQKQTEFNVERFLADDDVPGCMWSFPFKEIYPDNSREGFQFEELFCKRWKAGRRKLRVNTDETIIMPEEMEETMCVFGTDRRKSYFPSRQSLAPVSRPTISETMRGDNSGTRSEKFRRSVLPPTAQILDTLREESLSQLKDSRVENSGSQAEEAATTSVRIVSHQVAAPTKIRTFQDGTERPAVPVSGFGIFEDSVADTSGHAGSGSSGSKISKGFSHQPVSPTEPASKFQVYEGLAHNRFGPSRVLQSASPVEPVAKVDVFEDPSANVDNIQNGLCQRATSPAELHEKFEIFEDEGAVGPLPAAVVRQPEPFEISRNNTAGAIGPLASFRAHTAAQSHTIAPSNRFEIFEDVTDRITSNVFKTPAVPQRVRQAVASESNDDEKQQTNGAYAMNESCTTQTFNLFIKAQSVSTPKHARKSQHYTQLTQHEPEPVDAISPPSPALLTPVVSPPSDTADTPPLCTTDANSMNPQKQLSVIMEVTETNTKSSGENDFDTDSVKSQNTVKAHCDQHSLKFDPIVQMSTAQSIEDRNKAAAAIDEDAIPTMMMSMKVFEEKTEKVPKILLAQMQPSQTNDDNFYNLFTTTPPKGPTSRQPKPETFAVDDSMTFSKLQKRSVCNEPETKQNPTNLMSMSAMLRYPAMTQDTPKNSEAKQPEIFAVNDSMTFSKLMDFTLPKIEENSRVKLEQQDIAIAKDKSIVDGFESFESTPGEAKVASKISVLKFEPNNFSVASEFKEPKLTIPHSSMAKRSVSDFEDSIRTAAFTPNLIVQNSTLIPPPSYPRISQIQETSVHIKEEAEDDSLSTASSSQGETRKTASNEKKSGPTRFSEIFRRQSHQPPASGSHAFVAAEKVDETPSTPLTPLEMRNQSIIWLSDSIVAPITVKQEPFEAVRNATKNDYNQVIESMGRSIYEKSPPRQSSCQRHDWSEVVLNNSQNDFVRDNVDLGETRIFIENKINRDVNPFDPTLIKAFLDQVELLSFIEKLPTCSMVNRVKPLHKGDAIIVAGKRFDVMKMIGQGNYGTVFCAKEHQSGEMYALKQEKPANLWEYYICLELKSRISNDHILRGFMDVECAVIGNNASILISGFSKYGTLIDVCHKIYQTTGRNIDEFVVMVLASQLLAIIDHLHAANIIHADIKPDNFLLISKLFYPSNTPAIQLIDFGVAIDMCLFPSKQTFTYVSRTEGFTCIEMLENRPWTFQTDLFGLAATIHVLLFGTYMDVEKHPTGYAIKNRMPRYFNKTLWSTIFSTLLNIRDCNSMPNLQQLRSLLEEEIAEKERLVRDKINEFNNAIGQ